MKRNILFAAIIAIGTFLLFFGSPDRISFTRSFKAFWDVGHIIYFFLFTLLLNQTAAFQQYSVVKRWFITLAVVLLAGVLIETLQYGTDRSPDFADLSRNLTGALLVLAFSPTISAFLSKSWKRLSRIVVAIIFILQLLPLSIAIYDETIAWRQFPILANFDNVFELDRWQGGAEVSLSSLDGEPSDLLKIQLSTDKYSGTGLKYFPKDWSKYTHVTLRFYQPGEEVLRLTVRIHDALHNNEYGDRFNKGYLLSQGWTEVEIPLVEVKSALDSREMDLTRVRGISFFATRLKEHRYVYLDKIYLSF